MLEEESGFIKTASQNFVSRKADIREPQRVELKGKSVLHDNILLRGDLARIQIGRYVTIGQGTTLSPPLDIPLVIRSHTIVGSNCEIHAAAIGSFCKIGDSCKIGNRCIIKDACSIEEGTILGDDTVVAPFSRVKGRPGQVVDELPPSAATDLQEMALETYQDFVEEQATGSTG